MNEFYQKKYKVYEEITTFKLEFWAFGNNCLLQTLSHDDVMITPRGTTFFVILAKV